MKPNQIFNKKLLVEGKDDQHVIWALCEKFKVKESFDVIDCEGIDRLIEQIPVRFKQSGLEALGVIIDADSDIGTRWDSLKGLLSTFGYIVPLNLPLNGLILRNEDNIKVGVWIMPNNNLNGMLEDFIVFLVPKDDQLSPIVNQTLDHIESLNLNKYSLIHKSKATIHSWLSLQEDPGTPMGLAITKRFLTTEEQTCGLFIKWLDELFNT
ncbi:MAG: DUF3226 domain-containing protein [Mariniphaga sp.]